MPHRDYPRPTIYNLTSSYRHLGSVGGGSSNKVSSRVNKNSKTERPENYRSRDGSGISRPRPLFIDRALPLLAKEDPLAYSLFLEGVTLLAYNIAWACLTQNIPIGDHKSFEDVCNMGQNLYKLLIGQQSHDTPAGNRHSLQSVPGGMSDNERHSREQSARNSTLLGRYSHGTTQLFLGSAVGTEFYTRMGSCREWRLGT
jgi:hypothetical protein